MIRELVVVLKHKSHSKSSRMKKENAIIIKTKFYTFFCCLIAFLSTATIVKAGENKINCRSVLKFTGGIVAAFSIHEASHALVAGLTGTDMNWEVGNYNQPIGFTEDAPNDFSGFALNAAGLLSQAASSEIILRNKKIDKNDAFVRGMMAWNVINPILYTLDYWFFRISNKENGSNYQGDIEGIEQYSNEPTAHGFAISMAAIAAWQGYRFLKTQTWAPDWLKSASHQMSIEPTPSGGIMALYRHTF